MQILHQHRWLWWTCVVLLIIGGLNWGAIGVFDFNFVHAIFSHALVVERIVYIIVGIAAIIALIKAIIRCSRCCCGSTTCEHDKGKMGPGPIGH